MKMPSMLVLWTDGVNSASLLVQDFKVVDGSAPGIVVNGYWNLHIKNDLVRAKTGRVTVNKWQYKKLEYVAVPATKWFRIGLGEDNYSADIRWAEKQPRQELLL